MRRYLHAVVVLLLVAAPAVAQPDKALELVPHDALGFILIKDLRQLSDNVERLAKKLNAPEHASLLELIQKRMGIPKGLNEKGSAILIAPKGTKESSFSQPVFAVPVADYQAILQHLGAKPDKDGIGEGVIGAPSALLAGIGGESSGDKPDKAPTMPVLIARKGDFALLASPEDRELLTQVLTAKQSIANVMRPARAWLLEHDISGICTHNGVKVGLAMLLSSPAGGAQSSTQGQYAQMKATFAEVEKNVELIAFGARLEEAGHARLLARAYFNPNGPYAQWMAKAEPVRGDLLARFPDGPYFLAALARISPQVTLKGVRFFLPEKLPREKAEELTKAALGLIQRTSEIGLSVYRDPSGDGPPAQPAEVSPGPGWPMLTFLARVDDSSAFVAEAANFLKQCHQAERDAQATRTEAKFHQTRIAGRPAQLITYLEENAKAQTGQDKDSKASPGKRVNAVILLTALDAQTVLVALLPDASRAESLAKQLATPPKQSLGASGQLRKTTALLPEQLQAVVYLSMPTLGAFLHGAQVPESPPVAFALRTLPAGTEAQFLIPFDTLRAVFETFNSEKDRKK